MACSECAQLSIDLDELRSDVARLRVSNRTMRVAEARRTAREYETQLLLLEAESNLRALDLSEETP